MTENRRDRVTAIISGLSTAEPPNETAQSPDALMPFVYEELRGLARHLLAGEREGHTLQPTALVHEAYIRLVDSTKIAWNGRTHFFAVGARVMRRILVDHARKRGAGKRGGDRIQVTLSDRLNAAPSMEIHEVLTLDDALHKLADLDERQARIVEMRFFAGLTMEEIAQKEGMSKRTVEGDWTHAIAWLNRELSLGATDA